MAKWFPKKIFNDLDPGRTRRRHWRKTKRGDILRMTRATTASANQKIQAFGMRRYNIEADSPGEVDIVVTQGATPIVKP